MIGTHFHVRNLFYRQNDDNESKYMSTWESVKENKITTSKFNHVVDYEELKEISVIKMQSFCIICIFFFVFRFFREFYNDYRIILVNISGPLLNLCFVFQ